MGVYVLINWVGAVMLNNKMCSEMKLSIVMPDG